MDKNFLDLNVLVLYNVYVIQNLHSKVVCVYYDETGSTN